MLDTPLQHTVWSYDVTTVIIIIIIINTGQTELADSARGTALSQIKTIHIVIYITIDKKSMSNYKKFS